MEIISCFDASSVMYYCVTLVAAPSGPRCCVFGAVGALEDGILLRFAGVKPGKLLVLVYGIALRAMILMGVLLIPVL